MTNRITDHDLGPYEEDHRGFEIKDDETARGPLILALALGVLLVFGAVVWNTYSHGVRSDDGALPMVVADQQPYKRVPDERGGIQIDDLDNRLYDALDGSTRPPAVRQVAANNDGYLRGAPPRDLRPSASPEPKATEPASESPAVSGDDLPPIQNQATEPAIETAPVQSVNVMPTEVTPAEPEPAMAPEPELRGEPDHRFAFVPGGEYLVQISAVRTHEAAEAAWSTASKRHPDIFSGAHMSIQKADLGAKGIFYRLRAGAFGSRDGATKFCSAFKANGGDCIVIREAA
ncbi:SPOR domain-containing protein [Henriciella litoralis]|uniref:SPOR domain-containing protein n=1 Tax=Henriciella litoralis TaxID=568102 RepID=UPI000A049799|nr:SPOR domain-containing protein [Henriciella litoralis]